MSKLNTFVDKVKSVIDGNAELKNSVVLNKVLESVRYTGNDIQFLTDLKESLSDVNKFLCNEELGNVISSIDMKLNESANTDSAILSKLSNEFDVVSVLEGVVNSKEYSNPSLHSLATSLLESSKNTQYKYLMINPIVESLKGYGEYKCVNEAIDKCNKYINENQSKLVVLDAANYLSTSKLNDRAVKVLVESLRTNNFNPDSLSMKLGASGSGVCANVLESLRQIRQDATKGFDLGSSKNNVSVYEYIGPVLVEGADVTFNVNGKFIHITPADVNEDNVNRVVEGKSAIKVFELNEEYVRADKSAYYNTQKAFESLGFHLDENASVAKLNRSSVAFKLNESMDVDIMYNGKVSSVDEIKHDGTQMFESSKTKSMLYGLLENSNMIGHMKFVKFLTNESAASMVINLGDDYYVYDYTSEGVDTYKFDAFKLYEFCICKFNHDISSTFGFAINNARSKYNKIEEGKKETLAALDDLNESLAKLDEALKGQMDESDREMLKTLRKSFEAKINEMNETYQNLCKDQDRLISMKSCLIKEDLTEDEGGNAEEGDGEESTQPEENTTDDQDMAEAQGADDSGSDDVSESVVNECGEDGTKQVIVVFEDGSETVETVDSELPEEEINKIYATGNQLNGKTIANVQLCGDDCDGCNGECEENTVKEVNEGFISVPEWAVSALVENDFRGLNAERYNEALQYRSFLAKSGVVSLVVDESRDVELLDSNNMNENREECVYLKYRLNEGFFKKDIYGVESPFAGITNLGLFKDGKMKKACNKFLEECAPIVVNKCKFAILQSLVKLKAEGEDKLDDASKEIINAYQKYDENSLAEEIKLADEQLKQKTDALDALKNKLTSSKKELAPAFNYDVTLTKAKLSEIKSKILEAFREGNPIEGVDQMDKFKASQQVAELTNKAIKEATEASDKLKEEANKLQDAANQVAGGSTSQQGADGGNTSEKIKAFDVNGKESEIELVSGIKFKNTKEGDEYNGTEFELGEKSGDGTAFKIKIDGAQNGNTISVDTLKTEVPSGNYKVVSMPEKTEEAPAETSETTETTEQNS